MELNYTNTIAEGGAYQHLGYKQGAAKALKKEMAKLGDDKNGHNLHL